MEQKILKFVLIQLRIAGILLVLSILALLLSSYKAKRIYADIWEQLGISEEKANGNIRESFLNGYFYYYGASKAKNLLTGDRAAIAKDLLQHAKVQIESEAFKKSYDKARASAMPRDPQHKLKTREEFRKEKIAETEKAIKSTEETIKKMPDLAKDMQGLLELFRNNLKEYKDSSSAVFDMLYDSEVMTHENSVAYYKESVAKWEKSYPADHRIMIRERLQAFVNLAKTVDFNAALKLVNGKKKFVNPAYENKSSEWKMIFRAGREVIEPSVAFAQQWIKELNQQLKL
ncbi:MAG TPA: hypothetical protein VFR58_14800 [Flavisolibacter sp.]|nr:hypothetical protein [Flavisolibacter sp.]